MAHRPGSGMPLATHDHVCRRQPYYQSLHGVCHCQASISKSLYVYFNATDDLHATQVCMSTVAPERTEVTQLSRWGPTSRQYPTTEPLPSAIPRFRFRLPVALKALPTDGCDR